MFIFSNVQFRLEMKHSKTIIKKTGGDFHRVHRVVFSVLILRKRRPLCTVGAVGRVRLGSSKNKCSQLYGMAAAANLRELQCKYLYYGICSILSSSTLEFLRITVVLTISFLATCTPNLENWNIVCL